MKIIKKPIKEDPIMIYNKMIITEQAIRCPFCKSKFPTYYIKDLSDYDPYNEYVKVDNSRREYKKRKRKCVKILKDIVDIKQASDEHFHTLILTCPNKECQAQWETDYMYWATDRDTSLIKNYLVSGING